MLRYKAMLRYGVTVATTILALVLLVPDEAANAQTGARKGGGGRPAAARPAGGRPALSRPASHARPQVSRPAVRRAPAVRQASPRRSIAPVRRFTAPKQTPRLAAPRHRIGPAAKPSRSVQKQQLRGRPVQGVQRQEPMNQQAVQQRLQQLQSKRGRLSRADRRELDRLQRTQRLYERYPDAMRAAERRNGRPAVTAEQATRGRFAAHFAPVNSVRNERRAARLAARAAWRLGLAAAYVPWHGPVYWPYAYDDIFYSTFWPDAYDPGYWAYAYDNLFDGVFFPYGAPYVESVAEGPYGAAETTGAPPRQTIPGRLTPSQRTFCTDQATGATAWPFEQIERAVQPNAEQKRLLDQVRQAAAEAATRFRDACPNAVPLTPPGRLQAMTLRLQATLDAVKAVRPGLTAFYESISDEQKARFNELGPDLGRSNQRQAEQPPDCSGDKAGLNGIAVERIQAVLRPNAEQKAALDRLDEAMQEALEALRNACPMTIALTPVGRLEVMQRRLEAMVAAASAVRPALSDFYAVLSAEQKAKFNRLGRETAAAANP